MCITVMMYKEIHFIVTVKKRDHLFPLWSTQLYFILDLGLRICVFFQKCFLSLVPAILMKIMADRGKYVEVTNLCC